MNRMDRLMAMVLFLQGRRLTRAEDLAQHFGLSIRTVYRDLAALSEAGVPIVAEAGVGYSLLKGYHLPPVTFTPEEAGALATGGVLVERMTDASLTAPMRSALLKIRAVLPRDQQERLERIENATLLQSPDGAVVDTHATLSDIQEALASRKILRIRYRTAKRDEVNERDVEPLGLLHYLQYWHLIAWCRLRGDVRDFRLDRIQKLSIVNEHFVVRPELTLADYLAELTEPSCSVTARIKFSKDIAERAKRDWSLGFLKEEILPDGVVLTVAAGAMDWFTGWLLSYGTCATVLEPPELRTMLVDAAERLAKHHAAK